jgi:hypothetical protein
MPMHKTKNIIFILVTLLSGGCSALQGTKLIAPETFGLVPIAPNVYFEQNADDETRARLRAAVGRAKSVIQAAYGLW